MDFRHFLAAIFLLAPLAWVLGVDQLLLYLALPFIMVRVLAGPLALPDGNRVLRWALLTLFAAMTLSAISILNAPSFRWVTYARDYLAIASFIGILLLQRPLTSGQGLSLLQLAVWFMFVANLAGLAAWATGFTEGFLSPAGYLVPAFVMESALGQNTFFKQLADSTSLFGFEFTRVKSFSIYPNTYALAVGVSLPMTFYLLIRNMLRSDWIKSIVYAVVFLLGIIGLILSSSRSGIAAMAGGFAIFAYLSVRLRLGYYARISLKALVAVTVLVAAYFVYAQWSGMIYEVAVARGASNLEHRSLLYYESFRQVLGNPIGFGTQRDAPGILLPLGSHSQFIAVTYKYGFAGLAAWLAFLFILVKRVFDGLRLARDQGDIEAMSFYATMAWALFTNIAHQITAEVWLDTLTFTVIVTLWLTILIRPLPASVAAMAPARSPPPLRGRQPATDP